MLYARGDNPLGARLRQTAFAFRGYNVANLGRTPELLAHPAYGPTVEAHLRQASEAFAEAVGRPADLVARVRAGRESSGLADYAEDVALIVAVNVAHLRLLEEFFGVALHQARWALGHSLGEPSALVGAGVYAMEDILCVTLALADDAAALAEGVTLALLFSRGPVLDIDLVRRLCLEISQEGQGVVDVSTYLSPNSLLLMAQNGTLERFEARVRDTFPDRVLLRRNDHAWPPLHTPITWQRSIPNRSAVLLQTRPGGLTGPSLPVLSMVTGEASYRENNSRELLHRWVDHPQRLWDVIYRLLAAGVQTVVHVGPSPNLVPATFRRLSQAVEARLNGGGLGGLGRRTLSRLFRRPWLTRVLPSFAVLHRAPLVQHIILEDWLLAQRVP